MFVARASGFRWLSGGNESTLTLAEEMTQIRATTRSDADVVGDVHLSAFPVGEGEVISKLAVDLLSEETDPPILSLVTEVDGAVVGHVAISPVTAQGTKEFLGYILAPLAVRPDYQKRGIGSRLIKSGMERLSGMDSKILLVYGDPKYYGKFGFSTEAAERYVPPYPLQYSFGWQGMALRDLSRRSQDVRIACVSSLCDPALW